MQRIIELRSVGEVVATIERKRRPWVSDNDLATILEDAAEELRRGDRPAQ